MMHDFSGTVKKSPEIMTIHTTLYDLSAALSAEVGPDEEDVLTAVVIHLLHTHRVTCTGSLKGYRLRAMLGGIQPYTAMALAPRAAPAARR